MFLILGTVDILGWINLCCGDCPVCHRMFSSIPGLCQMLVIPLPPTPRFGNQKYLQILPNVLGVTRSPWLRTFGLNKAVAVWEPAANSICKAWMGVMPASWKVRHLPGLWVMISFCRVEAEGRLSAWSEQSAQRHSKSKGPREWWAACCSIGFSIVKVRLGR